MEVVIKYFPDLSETKKKQFFQLKDLYIEWNSRINVISRQDIEDLYIKHILHSLAIAKIIQFTKGSKILDVGTGGGFPGIPLAIMFPDVEFLLVDSVGKKIKVVNAISSSIGLKNLESKHTRVEQVKNQFDFVVSRAVTRMRVFQEWVHNRVSSKQRNTLSNGILYLKGGDLIEELKGIPHHQYNISDFFEEEFFETKKVVYIGY